MRLTRRDALRIGAGALAAPFAVSCGTGGGQGSTGSALSSSAALVPKPFTLPLRVPPVLRPDRTDATTDYYEIVQRPVMAEILPGKKTGIWGYNGIFPGPTIESRSGRRTVVRHRNDLPVPTVVHLHGGKTPPASDGYPTDFSLPEGGWPYGDHDMSGRVTGPTREHVYPVDQPAATLWYHDHRMDFTGAQVWRGLAGFHLIHDEEEDRLPLPKGERDIPLMICDRAFHDDGSFAYPARDPKLRTHPGVTDAYRTGVLGDVILVNGVPWPFMEVDAARYRFRILNASNARHYSLALDPPPADGSAFTQVGSDAGLLGAPVGLNGIEIAQAERFDVVIDFSKYKVGTKVTLTNTAGSGGTAQVMQFHVARRASDDSHIPARLADFQVLTRADATVTRNINFQQDSSGPDGMSWTINGKFFDPERVDVASRLGAIEIWKLTADVHHPIHVHLAHFQVLSRVYEKPRPTDSGWKDTVDLKNGDEAEIIVKMTGYRGRYVFHCHNLEHEDMGMMANLQVE